MTGWGYSEEEATLIADRIYMLERLFNAGEGFCKTGDNLPWRCLNEPLPDGQAQGNVVPLDRMLKDYYEERGWNQDSGLPKKETIERLGISGLVREYR